MYLQMPGRYFSGRIMRISFLNTALSFAFCIKVLRRLIFSMHNDTILISSVILTTR